MSTIFVIDVFDPVLSKASEYSIQTPSSYAALMNVAMPFLP